MSSPSPLPGAHTNPTRRPAPHAAVVDLEAAQAQLRDAEHSGPTELTWSVHDGASSASARAAATAPDAAGFDAPSPLLEGPEARAALGLLRAHNLTAPAASTVRAMAAQAALSTEHAALVGACRDALTKQTQPSDVKAWAAGLTSVLGQHPTGKRYTQGNVTAYVFLVMLQAQKEAINEKRESLKALKMYAGMLEDLNAWIARVVVPAQRALNSKIKEGHLKDSLQKRVKAKNAAMADSAARAEEVLDVPDTIDTQWGAVDPETGRVFIPNLTREGTVRKKLDAQDLATLVTQTDQWRATLQNHQNKQSMDFKRIDDAMSSTWNMLSAFLKSAQEGTNAIIRNGLG